MGNPAMNDQQLEYLKNNQRIMTRLAEEANEALSVHPTDWFVICGQGSINYPGLSDEESDVDSKMLTIPSFKDIVQNKQPLNKVYEMKDNGEHVDLKDVREYMRIACKQNINFVEIFFTNYWIANQSYKDIWLEMMRHAEEFVHMNPYRTLKCCKGMCYEKQHALEHRYPSRAYYIDTFGYDCYQEDTLFLTQNGWKKYDEIEDSDLLGTINPQNLSLEFQPILSRVKHYNKEVYHIESWYSCFEITNNHNLFCSDVVNRNKNGYKYKSELASWKLEKLSYGMTKGKKDKHIISFPYNKQTDNKQYSDDFLYLLGAYISEGTCIFRDKDKTQLKSIRISQTDHGKQKFSTIMDNLSTININKFSYYRNEKDCIEYIWETYDKDVIKQIYKIVGHISYNKRIDYSFIFSLSKEQCQKILLMTLLGDGTKDKDSNRWIYYTSSKQLAYDIVTLAHLAGYESNLFNEEGYISTNRYGEKPMYQVAIKQEICPHYINISPNHSYSNSIKHKIPNQTVVCFEVENGTLVTMKNGKTACQGNCKQLSHALRVYDFAENFVRGRSYKECLIPTDAEWLLAVKRGTAGLELEDARKLMEDTVTKMDKLEAEFNQYHKDEEYQPTREIYDELLYGLIKRAVKQEIV